MTKNNQTNEKLLENLRDLERSYGNMRVKNVSTIRDAISHIEQLEIDNKNLGRDLKEANVLIDVIETRIKKTVGIFK